MRVIAVANQKGGVGKTTTAVNLSAGLIKQGQRVLLVDIDPQGNATVGSGIDFRALEHSIYDVLIGEAPLMQTIVSSQVGYDLLPAHTALAGAQVEMTDLERRDYRLADALNAVREQYDFIVIDCPPALNVLTVNALCVANEVLVPVQCEYYALEGLSGLMETLDLVRQGLNPNLKLLGLVRTMFDGRNSLALEVSEQLAEHFQDRLFNTIVPRNVRLAEAPGFGQSVIDYDPRCVGAYAYVALAEEVINRQAIPQAL